MAASSLFGLIALGAIIITVGNKNGVTKVTAPDDKAFKLEKDGVIVENTPRNETPVSVELEESPRTSFTTPLQVPMDAPLVPLPADDTGFVPLFNGKDLTGWKAHPKQPGNWYVANGVLIGSGPAVSHLYTERHDFTDFHLRVEARFNKGGHSGVFFRSPFGPRLPADAPMWPEGYEATINNARIVRNSTGGFYPGVGHDVFTTKFTTVPFGEWFTLEVIADGNVFDLFVNGTSSGYNAVGKNHFASGHIALQQFSPETVIEFRKIEIKELNLPTQKDPKEIGRFLGHHARVNRVGFSPDGLQILSGGHHIEHVRRTGGTHWFLGSGYTVRLWEVASGRNLFAMPGDGVTVEALTFSSDGRYAASSSAQF